MADAGDLQDRVAFITGAGRGQGRSHAVTLARAGATIVAVDVCAPIDTVPYPLATRDDLAETARLVEAEGTRCLTRVADVRDRPALAGVVDEALVEFGRLDVVVANAGVAQGFPEQETATIDRIWADYIAINLTGAWNTVQATRDALVDGARGGSVIIVSSTSGLKGMSRGDPRSDAYTAAKHGLVGIMRAYANELGPYGVRVNSIHPTAVATPMIENPAMKRWVEVNVGRVSGGFGDAMHRGRITVEEVSDTVLWLASDRSRAVTGVTVPVDAGFAVT
ncbi:mycofactocin-coupled SDR family oxidoreductase [Pseudonocardia endophytica]|uniref:SDR family mycofactocin-dependent oxidoreductase n=1 Tax=Pseudonocardia endophytica TaxID=401976 RepID=A0A4R1HQF3_PSEEN|nr:mycofactocin-coupled SDR family oxidoreductase [Pseudonocardia endophytica]TCK21989.1 SDR family mycofactocin-dependent oxidoreductase [Pseudonocardia endophytica]